ncbi:MAG: DUF5711 family protein [Eubacteriales bacterium]
MARGIFSHIKEKTDTMSTYLPYESVYYEKTADFYRIARYGVLIFLALFVVIAGIDCRKDLKAENFRYLFKYIEVNPKSTSASYKDIYYDADDASVFALYKGDLVVAGDGKIKLYNIAGRNIMTGSAEDGKALCDAGGKYLLSYFPGKNTVSLFNSFSKLYSINFDYPVLSASAGRDGSFSVITEDSEYDSVVYVYNSSFKSVYSWKSNGKYAASSTVSPNGKYSAILSYSANGANYDRDLTVRNISKDKVMLSVKTLGKIPISVGFFENSSFYALYADGIEIYGNDFERTGGEEFSYPLQFYRVFDEGIITVTGKTRADASFTFFDSRGHKKFTENFLYSILDIGMNGDKIYLLTDDAVYIYSEGMYKRADAECGACAMFVFDDGNVLLCYEDSTRLLEISDFK